MYLVSSTQGGPKVPSDFKRLVLGDCLTKLAETFQIRHHWSAICCVKRNFCLDTNSATGDFL